MNTSHKPDTDLKSDLDREYIRALRERAAELQKATSEFEHASLKIILVLNGGAAIAALACFGNLVDRGTTFEFRVWAVSAMLSWAAGLVAATVATRFGYLSQHKFYKAANRKVQWKVAAFLEGEQSAAATDERKKFDDDTDDGKCSRTIGHYASTCAAGAFSVGVVFAGVAFLHA